MEQNWHYDFDIEWGRVCGTCLQLATESVKQNWVDKLYEVMGTKGNYRVFDYCRLAYIRDEDNNASKGKFIIRPEHKNWVCKNYRSKNG